MIFKNIHYIKNHSFIHKNSRLRDNYKKKNVNLLTSKLYGFVTHNVSLRQIIIYKDNGSTFYQIFGIIYFSFDFHTLPSTEYL